LNASFRLRVTAVLVALLTVAVGVRLCGTMWREAALDQGFQMYDNNEHALDAARMADDLRAGAPLRFLGHVNARTVWPPLLPLLETPGFVLFGAAYDTAERQMVVFGFLMLLAAMAFGFALGGPSGVRTGSALVAFVASSPFVASFMVETMT